MDPSGNGIAIVTQRELVHGMIDSGLSVLPAVTEQKMPALRAWAQYQSRRPEAEEVAGWFPDTSQRTPCVCIVCGRVSGNVEMIDFDLGGESFEAWHELVRDAQPGLLQHLVIERSPSGGRHVVYRCTEPVPGNTKLAARWIEVDGPDEVIVAGKARTPRKHGDGYAVLATLIETRGEGGIFLCAPTDGYEILQGDLRWLPTITPAEREILIGCARSLDDAREAVVDAPRSPVRGDDWVVRPGDDFSSRGDVGAVLRRHGWTLARDGENQLWRRPGKSTGTSASLRGGCFYNFSTSAEPFDGSVAYSGFAVFALLEHDGDWTAAAAALASQGYGQRADPTLGVDLSGLLAGDGADDPECPVLSYGELVARFPRLREPVIHGLMRRGESMNVIASPKTGKSWLVVDLALAVATGRPWLDTFATEPGNVLIIDNELHQETSAARIPRVAEARGIAESAVKDRIYIDNIRGRLRAITAMGQYFERIEPGKFRIIVLDAFYRFMPPDSDENDNGTMAQVYNRLDAYADRLNACFILIHHSTKGNQSGKSVTDVGAGAGAQSRAADAHLVLRPHEEEGVVVLDAAVRSWPPVQPICLRWDFPLWRRDDTLDPSQLRKERPHRRSRSDEPSETWTVEKFVTTFVATPVTKQVVLDLAKASGISNREASRLISIAKSEGLLRQEPFDGRNPPRLVRFAGATTDDSD